MNYVRSRDTLNLTTFGQRVRFLREHRGLTQEQVRAALEQHGVVIGQGYISVLETSPADRKPSGSVVAGLADVLGTSADFLLGRPVKPEMIGIFEHA